MGCIKRITNKPTGVDSISSINGTPRVDADSYSGADFCSAPFVFSIDTTLGDATNTFIVPMGTPSLPTPMVIDWGDGSQTVLPSGPSSVADMTHTYASSGTYDISIDGRIREFCRLALDSTHIPKINDVKSWGNNFDGGSNLEGCINITTITAILGPDADLFSDFFSGCTNFNQDLPFSAMDTLSIGSYESCFKTCTSFNGDLSTWNPNGIAINMDFMFSGCDVFNNNSITGWDVSGAISLNNMFRGSSQFNQDLTGWDVSSGANLEFMFAETPMEPINVSGWVFKDGAAAKHLFADTWLLGTTVPDSFVQGIIDCVTSLDTPQQGVNVNASLWWLVGANAFAEISFSRGEYPSFEAAFNNLLNVKGWANRPVEFALGLKMEIDTNLGSISPDVISCSYGTIDWGDGGWERTDGTGGNQVRSHTYSSNGTYTVVAAGPPTTGGVRPVTRSANVTFPEVTRVLDASSISLTNNQLINFWYCPNLIYHDPTFLDNNTLRTTLSGYLRNCASFNGDVTGWNISIINNFNSCFKECTAFTGIGLNSWTFNNGDNIMQILWDTAVGLSPALAANMMIDWNANPNQGTGVDWGFWVPPITFSLSATVAVDGYDGAAAKSAYDNLIATTGSGKSWFGSTFFTWNP